MVVCPKCGGDTRVTETRSAKRYRVCKDTTCNARLSTIEVATSDLQLARKLFDSMEGRDGE